MSLQGKTVVVTRALHQAEALASLLAERGAIPLSYPCLSIRPVDDLRPFDAALRLAAQGGYDWLILMSSNAARLTGERLQGGAIRLPAALKIITVGASTAQVAQAFGLPAKTLPNGLNAETLANGLLPCIQASDRVLIPQSEIALDSLAERLQSFCQTITTIPIYQTTIGCGGINLVERLQQRQVDAITFTSPSTVQYLMQRLSQEGGNRANLSGVTIACIGQTTADSALAARLAVQVIPPTPTLEQLVTALEYYVEEQRNGSSEQPFANPAR